MPFQTHWMGFTLKHYLCFIKYQGQGNLVTGGMEGHCGSQAPGFPSCLGAYQELWVCRVW